MAYWIFKCNPKYYKLSERLADPETTITWLVAQFSNEIGPGDTVFVLQTGSKRAIRAVMRVDDSPRIRSDSEAERSYSTELEIQDRLQVACTITHRDINLEADQLREIPGLENLSIFHGFQQATNFRVTPQEGEILLGLVAK